MYWFALGVICGLNIGILIGYAITVLFRDFADRMANKLRKWLFERKAM